MKFSRYIHGISFQKPFPLSWLYQPIHIRSFSYIDSLISFFKRSGSHLSSRAVSSQVLSAASVLTIVFGMGTGVSPTRIATGSMSTLQFSALYFLCLSIRTVFTILFFGLLHSRASLSRSGHSSYASSQLRAPASQLSAPFPGLRRSPH